MAVCFKNCLLFLRTTYVEASVFKNLSVPFHCRYNNPGTAVSSLHPSKEYSGGGVGMCV